MGAPFHRRLGDGSWRRRRGGAARVVLGLLAVLAAPGTVARAQTAGVDPEKVRTVEACAECHVQEHEVWRKTPHATGFKSLHRKPAAEAIAANLGLRLIKRDSPCLQCHYTPVLRDDEPRAASGVSCESCHGGAAGWIDVHNDYGAGRDHRSEPADHRAERIAKSRAAGMRRTDDLYALASSCFGCHTVPDERLVNVGGHGTGSAGFELFAWSQGEIRHNFLDSFLDGDGTVNAERPPPRRRQLYLLGRALDLEHGLRGMAAATGAGKYASAMRRRVRAALGELRAIGRRAELPEVATMLEAVRAVDVVPGNGPALLDAAEKVGDAARRLLERHDGARLAALDPLLYGTAEDEDEALAELDPGEPSAGAATASDDAPAVAGGTTAGAAGADRPSAAGDTAAAARTAGDATAGRAATAGDTATVNNAVPAAGVFKRRVRPASRFATVGPGRCTGCHRHGEQAGWWLDDAHGRAIDPFFDNAAKNVKIATLYGLRRGDMLRGDQICADCHATVITGKEKREVVDGVGCESCHGPAAEYLEPHQEGDAALGDRRPGYRAALGLGMVELRDPEGRARVCTGCHYVTEPRLISAGHPSGAGFDYLAGMKKIRHWQRSSPADDALRRAFTAALAARGAVPDVPRARLASRGPSAAGSSATTAAAAGTGPTTAGSADDDRAPFAGSAAAGTAAATRSRRLLPPRPRPFDRRALPAPAAPVEGLELPPFPELEDATVEDSLLRLRQRLRLLYRAVAEGGTG